MMLSSYDQKYCLEKECMACNYRLKCVNYTSEPEYPWLEEEKEDEEFRTYVPVLDNTTGELIRNIASKIPLLGYPFKEAYKISELWYSGYRMKDLLRIVREKHSLEIKRILLKACKGDIINWIDRKIEEGEINPKEGEEHKNL